jgi:hypothetical protein
MRTQSACDGFSLLDFSVERRPTQPELLGDLGGRDARLYQFERGTKFIVIQGRSAYSLSFHAGQI